MEAAKGYVSRVQGLQWCLNKIGIVQLPTSKIDNREQVWVYEDIDEQWKEFTPGLQMTLEKDYSSGRESSVWQSSKHDRRQHTVNFRTQPMTYMVKCGDTIELNTVVERRVMHANSRAAVIRSVHETLVYISNDEDEPNTHTVRHQVDQTPLGQMSYSSDYSHTTTVHHHTTVRPSANRKISSQYQDDDAAIHQSSYERPSVTHDTMDCEPTYVYSALHNNKPSACRKYRSNLPDQLGDSIESTPYSLSRQLTDDSQVKVKASDHVAMTTKYTWDSNIPSYWAPMDGSSVKTVVLHPTDSEYQLVADTFLASLGNTLATVIQIERIQNPALHKQYINNKEIMDKTNPPATQNERQLWHGITVKMTQHGPMPITAINARGFHHSMRVGGEAVYGNGTYFAVEARKSLRYCNPDVNGHRLMYWCRVLTGEYTRGCTDLIVAPVKTAGTYDLYDSVVDIVESPTVFVIFEDAHAYPEYLINFK